MIRAAIITAAIITAAVLAAAPVAAIDWTQHPNDKIAHVALGGALSYAVAQHSGSHFAGIAAATALGIAKESSDRRFDGGDLASWIVGGIAGAAISRHLVITPRGIAWRTEF